MQDYTSPAAPVKPKKNKRIFLWSFLAVQAVFALWMVSGVSTASGVPTDCGSLDSETCNNASDAGTAIGAGIILCAWATVDIIMGIGYAVFHLSKRK